MDQVVSCLPPGGQGLVLAAHVGVERSDVGARELRHVGIQANEVVASVSGSGRSVWLGNHEEFLQEEETTVDGVGHSGEIEAASSCHDLLGGGVQRCREAQVKLVIVLGKAASSINEGIDVDFEFGQHDASVVCKEVEDHTANSHVSRVPQDKDCARVRTSARRIVTLGVRVEKVVSSLAVALAKIFPSAALFL
jgi:hypothetical protein